jgi:hypothetical protein
MLANINLLLVPVKYHQSIYDKPTNLWSFPTYAKLNLCMDLTRVEAGSNTSTVNLRVVRGDEMGLKKAAP